MKYVGRADGPTAPRAAPDTDHNDVDHDARGDDGVVALAGTWFPSTDTDMRFPTEDARLVVFEGTCWNTGNSKVFIVTASSGFVPNWVNRDLSLSLDAQNKIEAELWLDLTGSTEVSLLQISHWQIPVWIRLNVLFRLNECFLLRHFRRQLRQQLCGNHPQWKFF